MSKLKTIDELMAGKQPGEIKLRQESMRSGVWFKPYFKTSDKWYGECNEPFQICFYGSTSTWSIYTEPKAKVKRWQYAFHEKDCNVWIVECCFFESDESAAKFMGDIHKDYDAYKRLDYTETEFDE